MSNKASTPVLLSKHGTLCYGENPQTTFRIAEALETVSQDRIYKLSPLLKMLEQTNQVNLLAKTTDDGTIGYRDTISQTVQVICTSALVCKVIKTFLAPYAYLDDFAQIAGVNVPLIGHDAFLPIEESPSITEVEENTAGTAAFWVDSHLMKYSKLAR